MDKELSCSSTLSCCTVEDVSIVTEKTISKEEANSNPTSDPPINCNAATGSSELSSPEVNVANSSPPSTSANPKNVSRSSKSLEMQFYIDKLREMVPYAKNAPKLSKVQLIHSAIDYITDLQEALEARVKRKKPDSENPNGPFRSPLSNLSVTQSHNNLNISESPSSSSSQFPRQIESEDEIQLSDYPTTNLHPQSPQGTSSSSSSNSGLPLIRVNQNISRSESDSNKQPSETNSSNKTNHSDYIQSINQLFLRTIQEETLLNCVNKRAKDPIIDGTLTEPAIEFDITDTSVGPIEDVCDKSVTSIVSVNQSNVLDNNITNRLIDSDTNIEFETLRDTKKRLGAVSDVQKKRKQEEL